MSDNATAQLAAVANWELIPADSWPFFAISLGLSLLLAITEVASAYRDNAQAFSAVFNRWAIPYYLLYLLLTFLIGRILIEHDLIPLTWTGAVALGLLGPTLFKTQIKLFKPLAGGDGINANLERILQGVQNFCLSQINSQLSQQRIAQKLRIAAMPESELMSKVEALFGDTRFQEEIKPLIDERRELEPASVNSLLVELIEREDPQMLSRLYRQPLVCPPGEETVEPPAADQKSSS